MQQGYFTKYIYENAQKQGFHSLHIDYTFLTNGVNAICVLKKYDGLDIDIFDQGFFGPTISEATEEVAKYMSINYLGAENDPSTKTDEKVPANDGPSGRVLMIYNVHPRTIIRDFEQLFHIVGVDLYIDSLQTQTKNGQKFYFEFKTRKDANIIYDNYCGKELDDRILGVKYVSSIPFH